MEVSNEETVMRRLGAGMLLVLLAGCAAGPDPRPDDVARIRTGMTREATRSVLGTPYETMRFARLGAESWDYRVMDTWGYLTLVSVMFGPEGTVTGVVTQRLNDGGDHQ